MDTLQEEVHKVSATLGGTVALSAAMAMLTHPLTYVKVLIQVGHEPLPPKLTTTWLGKKVYRLPNFFQYAGHIKNVDGWTGLYRGLGPKVMHNVVNTVVSNTVSKVLCPEEEGDTKTKKGLQKQSVVEFSKKTGGAAVAVVAGYVVSYPFHVITVRMMVQFIGRETHYSSIWSSIREIYDHEGILGFFSGIVPHVLGELACLVIFRSLAYLINNFVVDEQLGLVSDVSQYTQGISQYIASMLTYPFFLVSNMMAVNSARLAGGNPPLMPLYKDWTECWADLGRKGLRNRGAAVFRRTLLALPSV